LIRDAKVALIPVSGFYLKNKNEASKLVRFNFGKQQKTLDEAVQRLNRYFDR
jgi:aspartate/methionine/tyrosine aminotransferase